MVPEIGFVVRTMRLEALSADPGSFSVHDCAGRGSVLP